MRMRGFAQNSGPDGKATKGSQAADRLNRRQVIQGAAAMAGGLLAGTHLRSATRESEGAGRTAGETAASGGFKYKGINYDVGTNEGCGIPSSTPWHSESMRRDIRIIRHDLHCNSIGIHGTDISRLVECSTAALESGLHVWLQPRLFESTPDEMLSNLADTAAAAERLSARYSKVTLNMGCEASLFTSGFIPGDTVLERIAKFGSLSPEGWSSLHRKLRKHLGKACSVAREKFKGPLTYGAGPWEWPVVDWSEFDYIGLDHYMDESNQATYVEELRNCRRFNKPIIILEFGCCTFAGADKAGGMGWEIVDYSKSVPELKAGYVRSEQTQADYIRRLFDIFEKEEVEGTFVYQFMASTVPHSTDPRQDLDMASYGVVKVLKSDPKKPDAIVWEPKLAFHEIAKRYRTL